MMSEIKEKIKKLLENNYNVILTGAPGTGKTFLAKDVAEEFTKSEIKQQIEFVQFHPSYDYTDFVEGIRPKDNDNNINGFERKDGIFKLFCKKALNELIVDTANESDEDREENNSLYKSKYDSELYKCFQEFVAKIKKELYNGPFQIKGFSGNEISPIVDISMDGRKISFTTTGKKTGKPQIKEKPIDFYISAYKRFVSQDVTTYTSKTFVENVKFWWSPASFYGFLKEFYDRYNNKLPQLTDEDKKAKKYVFIIDEINRGDINKILGELFYAIDMGYRGEKGKVETQYQNLIKDDDVFKNGFFIPENVYIIGTMNDIDRSIESMDFAIRRRFTWLEIKPKDTIKDMFLSEQYNNLNKYKQEIIDKMNSLNKKIETELGSEYQIGGSYFMMLSKYIDNGNSIKEAYNNLWDNHLVGVLSEYLRGSKEKESILGKFKDAYGLVDNNENNG